MGEFESEGLPTGFFQHVFFLAFLLPCFFLIQKVNSRSKFDWNQSLLEVFILPLLPKRFFSLGYTRIFDPPQNHQIESPKPPAQPGRSSQPSRSLRCSCKHPRRSCTRQRPHGLPVKLQGVLEPSENLSNPTCCCICRKRPTARCTSFFCPGAKCFHESRSPQLASACRANQPHVILEIICLRLSGCIWLGVQKGYQKNTETCRPLVGHLFHPQPRLG